MAETAGKGSNEKDTSKAASQMSPPSITLPKGGGAIHGRREKFAANPVAGTGSMTVQIATSAGRKAWPDPGKMGWPDPPRRVNSRHSEGGVCRLTPHRGLGHCAVQLTRPFTDPTMNEYAMYQQEHSEKPLCM